MSENDQIELIAEQLKRIKDNMEAHLKRLEIQVNHNQQLTAEQIASAKKQTDDLRIKFDDHETRIRVVHDDAVAFRTWSAVLNGGAMFTAFAAMLKAFFVK
jgi:tRNA U34 2-thiouridine synthase MnmA/TrmU